MIVVRLFFAVFFVVGVAMLRWNRRITEDTITANRAVADALDYGILKRVQAWRDGSRAFPIFARAMTVIVAVSFIGVGLLGVVVG